MMMKTEPGMEGGVLWLRAMTSLEVLVVFASFLGTLVP